MRLRSQRLARAVALATSTALAACLPWVMATPADAATSVSCTMTITVHFFPALHASSDNSGQFAGVGTADECHGTLRGSPYTASGSVSEGGTRGPGRCGADQGDGSIGVFLTDSTGARQRFIGNFHYVNTGLTIQLSGTTSEGFAIFGTFTIPFSAVAACSSSQGLESTTITGTTNMNDRG